MKKTDLRNAALPAPNIYDDEIACWPWQKLLTRCVNIVAKAAPKNGTVIDYMCGTGIMLTALREKRSDLTLIGCDLSGDYVEYARSKCSSIEYHKSDALDWSHATGVDVITATAGIHHLAWKQQIAFIKKIERELNHSGKIVIGEEVFGSSSNGRQREERVVDFFAAMLPEILKQKPSKAVVKASLEVFANDLLVRGEFKRDIETLKQMLGTSFYIGKIERIWPRQETGFGDYIIVGNKVAR